MPINLDIFFNTNDANHNDAGTVQNRPSSTVKRKIYLNGGMSVKRKIYLNGGMSPRVRRRVFLGRGTVSRKIKAESLTLLDSVKCHRGQARQLVKSRRAKHLAMRRPKKQVRFDSSAKIHDGMSLENEHLQRLILDYWHKKQSLAILEELLRDHKHDELHMLVIKVQNLLQRMQHSGKKTTLLLPRGGGRAVKLSSSHIPHINQLLQYAIKVRDECIRWCKLSSDSVLDLVLQDVPEFDPDL